MRLTKAYGVPIAVVLMIMAIASTVYFTTTAQAANGGITLSIDPNSSTPLVAAPGCRATVGVVAQGPDLPNVAGLQFQVDFDPTVVQIIDDSTTPFVDGMHRGPLLPNSFFFSGGVKPVDASTSRATVLLAAAQDLGPSFTGPLTVAEMTFEVVGADSSSTALAFVTDTDNAPKASDDNTAGPGPIEPVATTDGAINVQADGGSNITGVVTLQFRTETTQNNMGHSGHGFENGSVMVTGDSFNVTVPVEPNGDFTASCVPDGSYTLKASAPGHISATTEAGAVVVSGGAMTMAPAPKELPGGDVNNDDRVNFGDIATVAGDFGARSDHVDPLKRVQDCMDGDGFLVDLNCDDRVNFGDIASSAGNFGKRGSTEVWPVQVP